MKNIDNVVKTFPHQHTMTPISVDDISKLEQLLSTSLPNSYKYLLSTYGLIHTPNIFTTIVD